MTTLTTRVPTAPDAVREALLRVASRVQPTDGGWQVGAFSCDGELEALAEALYAGWYIAPTASTARPDDPPVRGGPMTAALRAAHALAGLQEEPWVVVHAAPDGTVVATSGERSRSLRPGDYVLAGRPGAPAAPGEVVRTVGRLDSHDVNRGLWWTFTADEPERPIGRVYLDLRPATAPRVVAEVTAALGAAGVRYQLKCPVEPVACERVDAMVLYHRLTDRAAVLAALQDRWARLGPLLDPAVPPLTCRVARGLSWADDDGGDRSFGEARCRALAAGLLGARDRWSELPAPDRLALLADTLGRAGIDPAEPWRAASWPP